MRVFWLVCAICLLASCNKPLTNPEEIDPIYRDLLQEAGTLEKEVEEKEKKVLEARENLKKIVPQAGQTRKYYGELFRAENALQMSKQKLQYYRVRANSRKFEARASYLEAFKAEKPWPDAQEYTNYSNEKKLKTMNRDWRARNPASKEAKKPEKAESHGGH